MLNQFDKAFFDVVTGRVIVIACALVGGISATAIYGSFIQSFPAGMTAGMVVWGVLGWLLVKRRGQRNRRAHA